MNEQSVSQRIIALSHKGDSLIFGHKFVALGLLFLFSAPNLITAFVIPKFGQIYMDALGPDHPLPTLTEFLLNFQTLLTCLAILWPTLGIAAVFRFKTVSSANNIIGCLLLAVVVQIAVTWFGLFTAMVSTNTGMSVQH